MIFTQSQIELLNLNYQRALQNDYKEFQGNLNHPFYGLQGIYEPLNLSADEVALNKLDEDMSPDEYLRHGVEPVQSAMVGHYVEQGATCEVDSHGIQTFVIPFQSVPYEIKKENLNDFTQIQRRYVLNLLYLFLEKGTKSKAELLAELHIK